ncbi:MAG: CbiX/SirB N-terminal domain-containing protein [Caldimonas sp.]
MSRADRACGGGRAETARPALILFAHGARDPRWAAPLAAVAERIRQADPGRSVELAFLEFMTPDLATAARRLADAGAPRIDVVPLFLGTGGHLRQDLPPLLDALRTAHPGVEVRLHPAIGEHEAVLAAVAEASLGLARLGE